MNIKTTARNFEMTDAIKEYIEKRVNKIGDFYPCIQHVDAVIKFEKPAFIFKILAKTDIDSFMSRSEKLTWMEAVDDAQAKIVSEIKKKKGKIVSQAYRLDKEALRKKNEETEENEEKE